MATKNTVTITATIADVIAMRDVLLESRNERNWEIGSAQESVEKGEELRPYQLKYLADRRRVNAALELLVGEPVEDDVLAKFDAAIPGSKAEPVEADA